MAYLYIGRLFAREGADMEAWTKILGGLFLLGLSFGYLYRPAFVLRVNAWARSLLFNDTFILLYRRRMGLVFFVCAVVFFYSGFVNLERMKARERPSTYLDLTDAYRAQRNQQYRGVIARCNEILKREPDNIHAWVLIGSASTALGQKDQADRAWKEVQRIDPKHAIGSWPTLKNSTPDPDAHR